MTRGAWLLIAAINAAAVSVQFLGSNMSSLNWFCAGFTLCAALFSLGLAFTPQIHRR